MPTTHLGLPLINAAQAQKHVPHNEALFLLDALAQLSVSTRNVTSPPSTPVEGDRVLVGANATGAFADKSNMIATFLAGAWSFLTPQAGWRCYVVDETRLLIYTGADWIDAASLVHELQNMSRLGVGTTANEVTPLAIKLNAALFTAKGASESGSGDLRFTLNKESTTKTVSQLYQSNYSGRAETGLAGDDNFHVKVSADGGNWKEALIIDAASGAVAFPSGGPAKLRIFTSSGVYTPTPGARLIDVLLFGGGGGGGSGSRSATATAASGGAGGGGGGRAQAMFSVAQLGASTPVTIGASGAGGAAQTTNGAGVNDVTQRCGRRRRAGDWWNWRRRRRSAGRCHRRRRGRRPKRRQCCGQWRRRWNALSTRRRQQRRCWREQWRHRRAVRLQPQPKRWRAGRRAAAGAAAPLARCLPAQAGPADFRAAGAAAAARSAMAAAAAQVAAAGPDWRSFSNCFDLAHHMVIAPSSEARQNSRAHVYSRHVQAWTF